MRRPTNAATLRPLLLVAAIAAASVALAGLGLALVGEPGRVPIPLPALPVFLRPADPPPAPPFPDVRDPVAYCRGWLDEPFSPGVTVIADASRTLEIERSLARSATLSPENAILLKSLGWTPPPGGLDEVMDVNETAIARCALTQRVDLSKENVLAFLAIEGATIPPGVRGLATVEIVAEARRDTTNLFRLEREEVAAVLALSGGRLDPRALLAVADVERRVVESSALSQRVVLDTGEVIAAQALSGPRGAIARAP